MDNRALRKYCAVSADRMFADFDRRKSVYADIARNVYPLALPGLEHDCTELGSTADEDINNRLVCTVPLDALRKGASGFHSNLTNPAKKWFKIGLRGVDMEDDSPANKPILDGLDKLAGVCFWLMDNFGLYKQLYKLYEHLLSFGFGAMLVYLDGQNKISVNTLRIGTYALGIGADYHVNRLVRRFSMSAQELVAEFGGSNVPSNIRDDARRGNNAKRYEVCNLIEPNVDADFVPLDKISEMIRLGDEFEYRSIYWLSGIGGGNQSGDGILRVSGYAMCPIIAPRFDFEIGDVYGRGRGIDALNLARGIQAMRFDALEISSNAAEPAIIASADFKDEGLRLGRGQINYANFGEQRGQLVYPAFATMPNLDVIRYTFDSLANEIKDIFFNSAFATIEAQKNNPGVKTATEIDALVREALELLGPVISNLNTELLDRLVRVFVFCAVDGGYFDVAPEFKALFGSLDVTYVSNIHLAQRASSLSAVRQWVQECLQLSQAKPDIGDLVEYDASMRYVGRILGVPELCIKSPSKVATERDARQEQIARAQQMQQMQIMADTASKVGGLKTTDDSVSGKAINNADANSGMLAQMAGGAV